MTGSNHYDTFICYKTTDGTVWNAHWVGNKFYHERTDGTDGHNDTIINYKTWDDTPWQAYWNATTQRFHHKPLGASGSEHEDILLNYITADGSKWSCVRDGDGFYHIWVADAPDTSSSLLGKIVSFVDTTAHIVNIILPVINMVAT